MPEEKAGELYLEELGTRTWTEYWFHLDEGYLRYYKREGDLDPIAAIPCRGIVAKSVGKSRVGKHAFRLDVTKQADGRYKYVLAGEEEADSLEWLEALREHGCQVNLDKIRLTARPEAAETLTGRFLSFGGKGQSAVEDEGGFMRFMSFGGKGGGKSKESKEGKEEDGFMSFMSFSKRGKGRAASAAKPAPKPAALSRESSRAIEGDMTMRRPSIAVMVDNGDIDGEAAYADVLRKVGRASLLQREEAAKEAAMNEEASLHRESSLVPAAAEEEVDKMAETAVATKDATEDATDDATDDATETASASTENVSEEASAGAQPALEAHEVEAQEDTESDDGGAVDEYHVEDDEMGEAAVVAEGGEPPAASKQPSMQKQPSLIEKIGSAMGLLPPLEPEPEVAAAAAPPSPTQQPSLAKQPR